MKLRVKATNETLPVAEDSFICGLRPDGSEVEFIVSDVELIPDNWDAFRREAAKDILAGMLSNPEKISIRGERLATIDGYVNASIEITDELIRQIKEK